MLNFHTSTADDFLDFGRWVWQQAQGFSTHEKISQFIVTHLYEEFGMDDGEPVLALVRIYRLTRVDELPDYLQASVSEDEQQVMALTGTYGVEAAWRDRKQSRGHQVIPVSAIAIPEKIPMFQRILGQLGIDLERLYATQEVVGATNSKGIAYVPDVPQASFIPAQADFVEPYGIKSLLALGGFMSGAQDSPSLYALFAFSREQIPFSAVNKFAGLPEFIGAALAGREGQKVFGD